VVRRRGDKRSFGDNVNRERIGEEVMENGPLQGQVVGKEVMKEVFRTMRSGKRCGESLLGALWEGEEMM
jgi:hypothetical protein